jgi:hypothetical protein
MISSVTEAQVRKQQGEYQHQVSLLPDLDDAERKQLVEICIAHFRNSEGFVMPQAGVVNLADGIRSRRADTQAAADRDWQRIRRNALAEVKA